RFRRHPRRLPPRRRLQRLHARGADRSLDSSQYPAQRVPPLKRRGSLLTSHLQTSDRKTGTAFASLISSLNAATLQQGVCNSVPREAGSAQVGGCGVIRSIHSISPALIGAILVLLTIFYQAVYTGLRDRETVFAIGLSPDRSLLARAS